MRSLMVALAASLFSTAAWAAGPPIEIPVGEDKPDAKFQLTGPADVQELKVKAVAGSDLFLGLGTYDELHAQVFDPHGKLIKSFDSYARSDASGEQGAELHPLVSGYYTLRVKGSTYADSYPQDSWAWAYPDCRGGPATACTIAPGKTREASFAGSNDDDAYVIKVTPGRRYVATLRIAGTYYAVFSLVDGKGRTIASQGTGLGPQRRFTATLKFVLPKTGGGPFLLRASPTDRADRGRGRFTLSLVQQ